jgi:flagellar protein FlgJ
MPIDGVTPAGRKAVEPPEVGRVRQAAQDFEAMMIGQMLATMRQGMGQGVLSGRGQRLYQSMLDDELGRVLARGGGLGLADVLVRELVRQPEAAQKTSSPDAPGSMSTVEGGVTRGRRKGDSQ